MTIDFATLHPSNDIITIDEIKRLIANGEFYLVTCRTMDCDFWDAISADEYDEEKDRFNAHVAESVIQITDVSQIDPEYITSIETYATKDAFDDVYWTCTITMSQDKTNNLPQE